MRDRRPKKKNTKCYCLTCYFYRYMPKWKYTMGNTDGGDSVSFMADKVLGRWGRKTSYDDWSVFRPKLCVRFNNLNYGYTDPPKGDKK